MGKKEDEAAAMNASQQLSGLKLSIVAKRSMYRAGIKWAEGETEISGIELEAKLADSAFTNVRKKLSVAEAIAALKGDNNFVVREL